MAITSVLIPEICVSPTQDCAKVNLYDKTGTYSSKNTNGWGLPNIALSSVTAASLTIQEYDAVADTLGSVISTTNVFSTLPNISGIPYQVTIGAGEIYYFLLTYTISGGATYTAEYYYVNLCEFECCLQKKVAKTCGCQEGTFEIFQIASIIKAIKKAGCCGTNLSAISKEVKKLKKLCADCGCGCK
jgi:hypothetical protein